MVITIAGFALVPIVLVLVEVIKRALALSSRYIPLLSILLGVAIICWSEGVSVVSFLTGVMAGASASGIYDFGTKTIAGKV